MKNSLDQNPLNLGQVKEKAHSLVHEISFSLENGDIDKSKELLKELDFLLHDSI